MKQRGLAALDALRASHIQLHFYFKENMLFVHVEPITPQESRVSNMVYPICVFSSNIDHLESSGKINFTIEEDDLATCLLACLKVNGVVCYLQQYDGRDADKFTLFCDTQEVTKQGMDVPDLIDGLLDVLGVLQSAIVWRNSEKTVYGYS